MKLSSKIAKIASAVLALTLLLSLTGCQMVARFTGDALRGHAHADRSARH